MEREDLLKRWHELIHEPVSFQPGERAAVRERLQERLTILHRLNGLGQYHVEGVRIEQALEDTNVLLRELEHAERPQDAKAMVTACLSDVY